MMFDSPENVAARYGISLTRGFLPGHDPVSELGPEFSPWEQIGRKLPDLIGSQELVQNLQELPDFPDIDRLDPLSMERAFQLLAFIGHAWIDGGNRLRIPPYLAQPWTKLAKRLQRPAVIAHPAYVLYNWYLDQPEKGMNYENLRVLQHLVGGPDEAGFILVTVWMEILGAKAVRALIEAVCAIPQKARDVIYASLQEIEKSLGQMTAAFALMRRDCKPDFFYTNIRPHLASFSGLVFEACDDETPMSFHGGSAAQSSILQSLDAGLGVKKPNKGSRAFLLKMRAYMPRKHAAFIESLERDGTLASFCRKSDKLDSARQKCLKAIVDFRNEHLRIMAEYIIAPAKNEEIKGTGGTHPSSFLKSVRNSTKQSD